MSRIPYPSWNELSEKKKAYASRPDFRMLNVARMAMHAPDPLWETQRDFAVQLVLGTTIDERLREVLILVVGSLSKSEYELFHHRSISRKLGFSDEAIAGIERGDFSSLSDVERAVAQFTTEVVRDVTPTDATVAETLRHFTPAQIFEMVAIIGGYMMTARVIGVGALQLDSEAVQDWETEKDLQAS